MDLSNLYLGLPASNKRAKRSAAAIPPARAEPPVKATRAVMAQGPQAQGQL